ncbi:MAG TPA: vanadium-dependent haloperoxidase, partial [Thermoanaerobaculia bacterium]
IAATLGAVSRAALNAVWYQKWPVHLRHRPESGGGIVHLTKIGKRTTEGQVDKIVLDSDAVQQSFATYGSYLLSQAFPEGSPAHPAYPTGHGTVGGACITVLKFFFDGNAAIPNPMVPLPDGSMLHPYTGADRGRMRVDGELHKLAHNISFGHGTHAGIHWRSDTDYSLLLGEAVALDFLQDQAYTYREDFAVTLTKMDGSSHTIKNF